MYTEQETARLIALFQGIEAGKAHQYAAPTYKDSPALQEMLAILDKEGASTEEGLADRVTVLTYVARCYDEMCRWGQSAKVYAPLLATYGQLAAYRPLSPAEETRLEEAVYAAVVAATRYVPADCTALLAPVVSLLPAGRVEEVRDNAARHSRRMLKADPVEAGDTYLSLIDRVEEQIDRAMQVDSCHEYWSLKAAFLAKRGIRWRSPAALNPGVRFD